MSRVIVEFAQLQEIERACSNVSNKIMQAKLDFSRVVIKLDWEVKSKSNIDSRCKKLAKRIENCSVVLSDYVKFVKGACGKYSELDRYRMSPTLAKIDASNTKAYNGETINRTIESDTSESKITKNKFTTTGEINQTGYKETEVISDDYGTATKTVSVNESNAQLKVSPQGVEIKGEQKIYEYNLDIETKYMNGHVNASVGTIETEAGFNSDVAKMMFGGYVEGESYDLVDAHIGTEITGLHFEISAGGNVDGLGSNVGIEVDVGKIEGDAHGKIGIDEKGNIVVDAGAKAMVTAVEGEISSTVQLGDIKADSTIKGYAGSIGVEGGIKYNDGKLTIEIGASLGVGAGVEVTIEPTGKTKEVLDAINNTAKDVGNCLKYGIGYLGHVIGIW